MSTGNPPAGYYADPSIPGYIRYWDGTEWVAGTSRPAPDEVADQVLASSQAGAGAAHGGAGVAAGAGRPQAAEAWRPESSGAQDAGQGDGPEQPQRRQAQLYAPQASAEAIPQQFQQQDVGTPQQYAQQPQAVSAQPAQAIPQQFRQQEDAAPQQYATPTPQQPAMQQPAPQRPAEPASVAPQIPESVATMVVPSAFGAARTGTFHFPGANANPFAGLPGAPSVPGRTPLGEPEVQTTVVELATPGSRILARIIDTGIAAVFSAPITGALLLLAHRHDHQYVVRLDAQATTTYTTLGMDGLGIALWACALFTVVLVSIVLEGFRLGRYGQTYGKRMAGIKVVRMPDGAPIGRGGAGTRRTLLFWLFAILPVVDIVALGSVLWGRPYRQGAHEKATSTVTIKA
ncbi:MAG TPA: RDD family protein [Actinospica sp.]|nr:RDD family protein [Actinospica sp.]